MRNKINLKKCLIRIFIVIVIFLGCVLALNIHEYQKYVSNYNQKIAAILQKVQEIYPEVSEEDLMRILNEDAENEDKLSESFLTKYGIDLEKDSVILGNEEIAPKFIVANVILVATMACAIIGLFLQYNQKKDKELAQITKYIEEINQRNYRLDINTISEDELSILKNEIYKTTVMLKETAEYSVKAKNDLKDSLSDISHQLKTPLTSMTVALDILIDHPDMNATMRQDFIRTIKREITTINFLVQSLLKLSKLDSNTVVFQRKEIGMGEIVSRTVENVSTLCDLKNIEIEIKSDGSGTIYCDEHWQVEALTNVLKNCVEHSPSDSKIIIQMEKNQVYASISIQDFGEGIDEEDQKHIFERFYKGKNASPDSVGIGLALAKAIVEADHGHIGVASNELGTTFTIKYFHIC